MNSILTTNQNIMKRLFNFYSFILFFLCCFMANITSLTANCPDSVDGFTSLGEHDGHHYYLSQQHAIPVNAQAIAASHGGYLATINTQAENDFLQQHISEMTHIGLSDAQTEGHLIWDNGDALEFQNFNICSFCYDNSESMDFVVMHHWNGVWSFNNYWNARPFIMEIACEETPPASCSFLVNHPLNIGDNSLRTRNAEETESGYTFTTSYRNGSNDSYIKESIVVDYEGQLIDSQSIVLPNLSPSESGDFYYDTEENNDTITLKAIALDGTEIWRNSITLTPPNNEAATISSNPSVKELDGKILITGNYGINGGFDRRLFFIQADLQGNILVQQFYDTYTYPWGFKAISVVDKPVDGGFYLHKVFQITQTPPQRTLIKTDEYGQQIWATPIQTSNPAYLTEETPDGSAIYVGYNTPVLGSTIVIDKINTLDGTTSPFYSISAFPEAASTFSPGLLLTEDGGLIFSFSQSRSNSYSKGYCTRLDATGNVLWSTLLPRGLSRNITQLVTSDSGFIFRNIQQDDQIRLFKVNSNGQFSPLCSDENYIDLSLDNLDGWRTNETLSVGDSVDISFDIHNNGFGVAENYNVNLYLKNNDLPEDIFVSSFPFSNTTFGIQEDNMVSFTIPPVVPGRYRLVLIVDGTEIITEHDENNNILRSFHSEQINTNCNTVLPGFTFLGTYDNHNYFISNEKANWETASDIAIANGSYLASFSTLEENNFIRDHISEIVLVGGRDENCDGLLEWDDGSESTFSNISNTCSASNFYTNMNFWNGFLSFDHQSTKRKFVMEIPCSENRNIEETATALTTALAPKLYPNPVFDNLFVELKMEEKGNHLLKIYNLSGQEVGAKDLSLAPGINRERLDVRALKPGVYFTKIIDPSGKRRFKPMRFVKVRD